MRGTGRDIKIVAGDVVTVSCASRKSNGGDGRIGARRRPGFSTRRWAQGALLRGISGGCLLASPATLPWPLFLFRRREGNRRLGAARQGAPLRGRASHGLDWPARRFGDG